VIELISAVVCPGWRGPNPAPINQAVARGRVRSPLQRGRVSPSPATYVYTQPQTLYPTRLWQRPCDQFRSPRFGCISLSIWRFSALPATGDHCPKKLYLKAQSVIGGFLRHTTQIQQHRCWRCFHFPSPWLRIFAICAKCPALDTCYAL